MSTPPDDAAERPAPEPPAADGAPAQDPDPAASSRRWGLRRRTPAAPAEPEAADAQNTEVIPAPPRPHGPSRLRRDRRRLLTQREDAVYHLGGLAFELFRRDMLSDGVMRARAAEVAQLDDTVRDIDVRLSEAERERGRRRRREAETPAVGCCLACRTPFRAEARFCWQCGAQVVPPPVAGDDQVTAVISSPAAP